MASDDASGRIFIVSAMIAVAAASGARCSSGRVKPNRENAMAKLAIAATNAWIIQTRRTWRKRRRMRLHGLLKTRGTSSEAAAPEGADVSSVTVT